MNFKRLNELPSRRASGYQNSEYRIEKNKAQFSILTPEFCIL
jgi:hypothetical protein